MDISVLMFSFFKYMKKFGLYIVKERKKSKRQYPSKAKGSNIRDLIVNKSTVY